MTKYRMRVETKVYFTVEVIAGSEAEAKEKIVDGVTIDEFTNGTWGVEISDYDEEISEYIDNVETESADEIWEDNIFLDEVIEEDVDDPLDDDDEY